MVRGRKVFLPPLFFAFRHDFADTPDALVKDWVLPFCSESPSNRNGNKEASQSERDSGKEEARGESEGGRGGGGEEIEMKEILSDGKGYEIEYLIQKFSPSPRPLLSITPISTLNPLAASTPRGDHSSDEKGEERRSERGRKDDYKSSTDTDLSEGDRWKESRERERRSKEVDRERGRRNDDTDREMDV